MASSSKDRSRKDDTGKSSAKKISKTKGSAESKATSTSATAAGKRTSTAKENKDKSKESVAKVKVKISSKSATASKSSAKPLDKKGAEKVGLGKSSKNVRDFMTYLGDRYPLDQKTLGRDDPILDHIAFAIFLENGSFRQARRAFSEILRNFVDWNETRVSRTNEIVDVVGDIPKARQASEHLRWLLQNVFSSNYDFSLEGLRQQDDNSALDFLRSLPVATRFVIDYVERFALGGKEIPLSDGALRALRLLGFIKIDGDRERLDVKGRALSQEESRQLFFQLHELGAELKSDATRNDVIKLLKGFDKKVAERSEESTIFDDYSNYDSLLERYAEQTRKSNSNSFGAKSDELDSAVVPDFDDPSVFDDEDEDYDGEADDFDASESVVETKMTSAETSFRDAASKPSRSNGKRSSSSLPTESASARLEEDVDDFSGKTNSKTAKKKMRIAPEDSVSKASSKKINETERKVKSTTPKKGVETKNNRPLKGKKSEDGVIAKVASKRKSDAIGAEKTVVSHRDGDAANVSASEPPDRHRKSVERSDKSSRSTSKSLVDKRDDETLGKGVKRTKTKDVSKKSSSRDASKLKEILRKKPR